MPPRESKISFLGGQDKHRSQILSPQEYVNCFPEIQDYGGATEQIVISDLDGQTWLHQDLGVLRGYWPASNEKTYVATSENIYELFYDPSYPEGDRDRKTLIGTIGFGTNFVSMSDNGKDLVIVDGTNMYAFNFSTTAFKLIPPTSLPFGRATHIAFQANRFVVNNGIGEPFERSRMYFSGLLPDDIENGWRAVDYVTAEGKADPVLAVWSVNGMIKALGSQTTEFWAFTRNRVRPFARIAEASKQVGVLNPYASAIVDSKLVMLTAGEDGQNKMYISEGQTLNEVTDVPTVQFLRDNDTSDAVCWGYSDSGHSFFLIHLSNVGTTFCFDLKSGKFHQRQSKNSNGEPTVWDCLYGGRYNGKIISGYGNGLVTFEPDVHTDADGKAWTSRMRSPFGADANRVSLYNWARIHMDTGVIQFDTVPKGLLRWSDDGYTWGRGREFKIGVRGEYNKPIKVLGLGMGRGRAWEISLTGAFRKTLLAMYVAKTPTGVI